MDNKSSINSHQHMNRLLTVTGLFVIGIALILRIWNIDRRGIFYHDEAAFLGNGRFYGGLLRYALIDLFHSTFSLSHLSDQAILLWRSGGTPILHARPLHEVLLIIISTIFGINELPGILLSVFAGATTVGLLVFFFRPIRMAGVTAGFLLCLSIWHLQYSRAALSQSLSLLLVCSVMSLLDQYQFSKQRSLRKLALISFLAGLTFTTHYNLFWLPILVGLWLLVLDWEGIKKVRIWFLRMAFAISMMVVPLILFEIPFRLIMPFARNRLAQSTFFERTDAFSTYFEQILTQIRTVSPSGSISVNLFYIPQVLIQYESPIFLLIILFGAFYLFFRSLHKDKSAFLLLTWAIIPLGIWSVFGFQVPRSFLPILPPFLLGFGLLFEQILKRVPVLPSIHVNTKLAFLITFLICVLLAQLGRVSVLLSSVSPWRLISDKIMANQYNQDLLRFSDSELTEYSKPIFRYYLSQQINREISEGELFIADVTTLVDPKLKLKIKPLENSCSPNISIDTDLQSGMVLEDAFYEPFVTNYRTNILPHHFEVYDLTKCNP